MGKEMLQMEIDTVGRVNHLGYHLKLKHFSYEYLCHNTDFEACYKLIFIEKGSGIVSVNSIKYVCTAPCILCLNEQESILFDESSDLFIRAVCFHPKVINKTLNFMNINEKESQLSYTDYEDTYLLRIFTERTASYSGMLNLGPSSLNRIINVFDLISYELEAQRDMDWPCRNRSFLFELLILLQRIFSEEQPLNNIIVSEKYPEIAEVILYLHTNYMNKITVDDLSKKYNINRTTLGNQFAKVTGLSIVSYLIKLRIDLASIILRDTLLPISEIIERVGLNDRTYFCRLFLKQTGYTPSEYRKKYCCM